MVATTLQEWGPATIGYLASSTVFDQQCSP